MANLAIFAGVRKDISKKPADEQEILTNLLLLLDKYDLYGKMAIPKRNDPKFEVPEIYRIAARKKGVFVNATPGENFGLTIVEAASCGLPVVASPSGGPKEILESCENGLLVNVDDPIEISVALKKIISDQSLWETFSANGIKSTSQLYSWTVHTDKYIETIQELFRKKDSDAFSFSYKTAYGKKLTKARPFIITDLDGTLIDGNLTDGLKELNDWVEEHKDVVVFGLATGRNRHLTERALSIYKIPKPDIFICSAGSEIYYTEKFLPDLGWESHIDFLWEKDQLQEALLNFPGLQLQEVTAQWRFKLSYYVDKKFDEVALDKLHKFLRSRKLRAKILLTDNRCLDLLPLRASKGSAVRYLSYKWKVPIDKIITAGNGGNDIDMLKGKTKGIVVANYSPELEKLKKTKSIFFSKFPLSRGVLDGIRYYLK